MGIGKSLDYPPLLAPGRHIMGLNQIKSLCVDSFPGNQRRRDLFHHLEEFVQAFLVAGMPCEIWLDGSLLTEKPEPRDLDVTVILDEDVSLTLNKEQLDLVEVVSEGRFNRSVDSFVFSKLPRDHENFGDDCADPAHSWGEQYGKETSDRWLKGFIVLVLRETNVGLRLRS